MMHAAYHGVGDNADMQILQHLSRCLDLTWRHAFQYVLSCTHTMTVTTDDVIHNEEKYPVVC